MRSNKSKLYVFSLLLSTIFIICILWIGTIFANSYKSAYDPSIQFRRSNSDVILTTAGYIRPIYLSAINKDNAADMPSTYAKPGIYMGAHSPAKKTFDDAFIGVGEGFTAGTLYSLLFGDEIIDDDAQHIADAHYDDDTASELRGAKALIFYIVLVILIATLRRSFKKITAKKNVKQEKKAQGLLSCLGMAFFYGFLPFAITTAMMFIPWKPAPDLRHAAAAGDVSKIQELVAKGDNININTNTGVWTPLAYAAEHGHLAAVKEILRHKPTFHLTPLVAAAANGHKAVWEALVNDGNYSTWLAGQSEHLFEIFNAAAKDNNLKMLEYLYATPLLKDVPNLLENALVEASLKGQSKTVDWLIDKGVNINFSTRIDGFTPLMMAAASNNTQLVKKFLELGSLKNATTRLTQENALSVADYHDYAAILQLLEDQ